MELKKKFLKFAALFFAIVAVVGCGKFSYDAGADGKDDSDVEFSYIDGVLISTDTISRTIELRMDDNSIAELSEAKVDADCLNMRLDVAFILENETTDSNNVRRLSGTCEYLEIIPWGEINTSSDFTSEEDAEGQYGFRSASVVDGESYFNGNYLTLQVLYGYSKTEERGISLVIEESQSTESTVVVTLRCYDVDDLQHEFEDYTKVAQAKVCFDFSDYIAKHPDLNKVEILHYDVYELERVEASLSRKTYDSE